MIFYISCTGNTKWAVEVLQNKISERIVDIAKAVETDCKYSLEKGERIGFCFPVHGWRPPKIVRQFIKKLCIEYAYKHYCYAVCTAGDNIGETIDILRNDLAEREIRLDSAFSLIMPESYVGLPFMDVDTSENETRKKEKSKDDLERFVKAITLKQVGIEELELGKWKRTNSRVLGSLFVRYLITDKPFRVTEDKCIKCGKCAAACPIGNVLWQKDSVPIWRVNGTCMSCFACYHHCPTHAIEYGSRTKNKGQYYFK